MKAIPVQATQIRFTQISISPKSAPDVNLPETIGSVVDTGGLLVNVAIGHGVVLNDDPYSFTVQLDISIDDSEQNAKFPYLVQIGAAGFFEVAKVVTDRAAREDFAFLAGTSLLYSAIREQVSTITARSWYGQLNMPMMDFSDELPSRRVQLE